MTTPPELDLDDGPGSEGLPQDARDIGSASRSCLIILLLAAVIVLIVCVALAVRVLF